MKTSIETEAAPQIVRALKSFTPIASGILILGGGLTLIGWTFDVPILRSGLPSLIAMNPVTAVAFILAGVSLRTLGMEPPDSSKRRIGQGCAFFIIVVGLLKLGEYLFGWNIGIDQWLFQNQLEQFGDHLPNRIAFTTALNFLLLGLAFVLLDVRTPKNGWPAQYLILPAMLASLFSMIGYLYNVQPQAGTFSYVPMAFNSALMFTVLCAGLVCARPHHGLMALVTSNLMSGFMIRRLIPAAIVIPIIIGWGRLIGEHSGIYSAEFGVALFVIVTMIIVGAMIIWTVGPINRADRERRRVEAALHDNEERIRRIIETANDAFISMDASGRITDWNAQAETIFGWSRSKALGQSLETTIIPVPQREAHHRGFERFQKTGEGPVLNRRIEITALHRDGHEFPVELTISPLRSGEAFVFNAFVHDITERKRAEELLRDSRKLLQDFLDNANDLIQSVTPDGRFQYVNRSWLKTLGYSKEDAADLLIFDIIHPDSKAHCREIFQRALNGESVERIETIFVSKDGRPIMVEGSINSQVEAGKIIATRSIFRDISERKQQEEHLKHLGFHDSLTGLPNRNLFMDRLTQAMARARWNKRFAAVLFLDLDHFKTINDTLGHDIGDRLLNAVAERLSSCVRDGDTITRLGGDEFAVLLIDIAQAQDVDRIARKILGMLSQPLKLEKHDLSITTSIGISLYPHDGGFPETLLKKADTAMYRAKKQGRNSYQFYSSNYMTDEDRR